MNDKKKAVLIRGYENGRFLGVKTACEWGGELGLHPMTVRKAKREKTKVNGKYTFEDASGREDAAQGTPGTDLAGCAKAAMDKGLTYGQQQAMELAAQVKVEHREGLTSMRERETDEAAGEDKQEEKDEEGDRDMKLTNLKAGNEEAIRDASKPYHPTLQEFASLIDGRLIMDIYIREDEGDRWIQTVPSSSPVLDGEDGKALVVCFMPWEEGESSLKVYVDGKDEEA